MKFPAGLYPGWGVHAGLFFCAAVVVGSSAYTFGLFVVPVTQELSISRADINNGYIALLLGVALVSPFVGSFLDRFSARTVIVSGAIVYAAGLALLALTRSALLVTKAMAVVAVRFIGEVHDRTGSYVPGFAAFSVAVIVSVFLVAMLTPQQREIKAQALA